MTTFAEPVGPHCPGCGRPPVVNFGRQAFCANGDCRVMTWNPMMTTDELLDSMTTLEDWRNG